MIQISPIVYSCAQLSVASTTQDLERCKHSRTKEQKNEVQSGNLLGSKGRAFITQHCQHYCLGLASKVTLDGDSKTTEVQGDEPTGHPGPNFGWNQFLGYSCLVAAIQNYLICWQGKVVDLYH